MWEMAARKGKTNACDLQRLMGFASCGIVWNWRQELRRAMPGRSCHRLDGFVVIDERYLVGKRKVRGRGRSQALALLADEDNGVRIRIEPADDTSSNSIDPFINRNISTNAYVTTDGSSGHSPGATGARQHITEAKAAYPSSDPFQMCHLVAAFLKCCWFGPYHLPMSPKNMRFHLQEFTFRFHRRKTKRVGRTPSRLVEMPITSTPITEPERLGPPIAL